MNGKLPIIPLKEKGICEYCGNEVGVGDYFLTSPCWGYPIKYMCADCYKGKTIFPFAVIESDYYEKSCKNPECDNLIQQTKLGNNQIPKFCSGKCRSRYWYITHKEKCNIHSKEWYEKHYHKYTYGITRKEFDKMVEKQNGLCFICGKPPQKKRNLSVDHCHKTGEIRGLLCIDCNRVLGIFNDNPLRFIKAARYLNDML